MKWLWEHGLIHPKVKNEVERIIREEFISPPDIIDRIKQDAMAWENYQHYSESYKRIRVAYIESARTRHEEFEKKAVKLLIQNERE